jgi:hypothetical protein
MRSLFVVVLLAIVASSALAEQGLKCPRVLDGLTPMGDFDLQEQQASTVIGAHWSGLAEHEVLAYEFAVISEKLVMPGFGMYRCIDLHHSLSSTIHRCQCGSFNAPYRCQYCGKHTPPITCHCCTSRQPHHCDVVLVVLVVFCIPMVTAIGSVLCESGVSECSDAMREGRAWPVV